MSIKIATVDMGKLPQETLELVYRISDDIENQRLEAVSREILFPDGRRDPIPQDKVVAVLYPDRRDHAMLH